MDEALSTVNNDKNRQNIYGKPNSRHVAINETILYQRKITILIAMTKTRKAIIKKKNNVTNSDNDKRNENDRENLSITDDDQVMAEAITK